MYRKPEAGDESPYQCSENVIDKFEMIKPDLAIVLATCVIWSNETRDDVIGRSRYQLRKLIGYQ